jgi:RNA polymerase sigma-70 factor, ECF subfamily
MSIYTPSSAEDLSSAEHLIDGCLQGKQSSWEALVQSYRRLIYSLCFRYSRRDCEANDLVQDVFVRIFQELGSFRRNQGSFKAWIIRVTRNLITDHFRKTRRLFLQDSLSSCLAQIEDKSQAPGAPDKIIRSKQARACLERSLQKLSPEGRKIIIMRDVQEMEYKEIARFLSIPEGTVKSRLNRNRAELLRVMKRTAGCHEMFQPKGSQSRLHARSDAANYSVTAIFP